MGGSNCIQGAFSSGGSSVSVTTQTMALTSDFTTDNDGFIDTTILLTLPDSTQKASIVATFSFKSDSSNTGYFRIEDGSTGLVSQRYNMITSNRVMTLNAVLDCSGQSCTLQVNSDGGDSVITIEGQASSKSQGTMNSLEVG